MQTPQGRKRRSGCQFGAGRSRVAAALSLTQEENGGAAAHLWKPGQTKEISEGKEGEIPVLSVSQSPGSGKSDTGSTEGSGATWLPVIEQGQHRAEGAHF